MATDEATGSAGAAIGAVMEGGVKLSDLISRYDGSSDVTEWLDQLKIAREPARITDLTRVLPAFLRGDAFKVYKNLPEDDKRDFRAISDALTAAFGVDEHVAFCTLVSRKWKDGESVDVYAAELKRLASVAKSDVRTVRMVFMSGLPDKVGSQLKTTPGVKAMEFKQVVELAREVMAATVGPLEPGPLLGSSAAAFVEVETAPWDVGAASGPVSGPGKPLKCFYCTEEGHVVRVCPKKQQKKAQARREPAREPASGSENATGLW